MRVLATVAAALIHVGLAAIFLFDRASLLLPTDRTPVVTVALVPPWLPVSPPRAVQHPRMGGDMRPAGAPNHRLVRAPARPGLVPIVTPPAPVVASIAPTLTHAPVATPLAPNPVSTPLAAVGTSAGGGERGSGSGDGAGAGRGGRGLSLVQLSAWIHRPTPAELESFYPSPARSQGLKGMAMLACAVMADTRVRACHVLAERPPWEGFGTAALEMTKLFRIRPTLVDGKVYEKARVAIPVYFGTPVPAAEN